MSHEDDAKFVKLGDQTLAYTENPETAQANVDLCLEALKSGRAKIVSEQQVPPGWLISVAIERAGEEKLGVMVHVDDGLRRKLRKAGRKLPKWRN